jgi:invasion protein IalB
MIKRPSNATIAAIVASLIAGWVLHGLYSAPPDRAYAEVVSGWRIGCAQRSVKQGTCELSQDVGDPKTHVTAARFAISRRDNKTVIDVIVPLNVLLAAKFGMKVDDGKLEAYPYHFCDTRGCIATIYPDGKLYASIVHAKQIAVAFESIDGKVLGYKLAMDGYGDALAAYRTAQSHRSSLLARVLL